MNRKRRSIAKRQLPWQSGDSGSSWSVSNFSLEKHAAHGTAEPPDFSS
jgi:hypothetical protein